MEKRLKVGILKETKNPPDKRVPLTPPQIVDLQIKYPDVEFIVQPSDIRCYTDDEYKYLEIQVKEDLGDCDILLGVKEVNVNTFIPDKTYMFFAHVAKEQSYNRDMFRSIIGNRIRLVDYEYLTKGDGARVVAFGRWAGIVGAYNGLRARGIRTDRFNLKPCHECTDLDEVWAGLKMIDLIPGLKILITGEGRVAGGAMETISNTNAIEVSPEDFLNRQFDVPVVCRIGPQHYTKRKDGAPFDFNDFVRNPGEYVSTFEPFTHVTDIFIAAHFWDPESPVFFKPEDMLCEDWKISVIADISCDIRGPVPSTLRATTIQEPFYGYNPYTRLEEKAFINPANITVMSVDNLPGELPRDASSDFGRQLIENIVDDLLTNKDSEILRRATICERGSLTIRYGYLENYLKG